MLDDTCTQNICITTLFIPDLSFPHTCKPVEAHFKQLGEFKTVINRFI